MTKYCNKKIFAYKFKKYNMIHYGCFDCDGNLLARIRKCVGGYNTKVFVNNYYYFSGVYPTVSKARKAILKRLANGN